MYYYIVNPAAGHSAIDSIQERLKSTLLRLNIDGEFAKTIGTGDAAKIAATAINKGFKTIVAVGGDATVNEILTAVHKASKPRLAVGIVPIGKQNTLAAHLGIGDWQQACRVLSARRLQSYSLMKSAEHVFIYSAEARPAKPKDPAKETPASFSYLLEIDGQYRVRGTALNLQIYNQKFLRPDLDNQLVVHVHPPQTSSKPAGLIRGFIKRISGSSTERPSHSQLHASQVILQAKTAAEFLIDGAPLDGRRWEIELSDNQIQLITNRKETEHL